jgi:phage minor structural protein
MGLVYVYEKDSTDFSTMGLCGALFATSCVFTEVDADTREIALEHPLDAYGKWSFLTPGRVVKIDVPVRIIPEIGSDGALVTTVERTTVLASASKANRYIYSKASGGSKKKLVPAFQQTSDTSGLVATEVVIVSKPIGMDRYGVNVTLYTYSRRKKIYTAKTYTGFMASSALNEGIEETIADDPAAIETVSSAWSTRPQLFRIYDTDRSDDGVTVNARHIFYDLLGNVTTWSGDGYRDGVYDEDNVGKYNQPRCVDALAGILSGCVIDNDFTVSSDIASVRSGVEWTRINPVKALLDPEEGLVARWSGDIVRDDYRICVLSDAGMNRGVRIEYAKNMLGVKCATDMSDVVTAIMPVGQTKKGKPLLLVPGTYTVGTTTVTVGDDLCVHSAHYDDYPTPHIKVLDLGEDAKATGTTTAALLEVRTRMVAAALEFFADGDPDLPAVTLDVDFLTLGDTEEYKQFSQLENVFLYDRVLILHKILGIDVLARVVRVEYDCLMERFNSITLGTERVNMAKLTASTWQMPKGIKGTKLAPESIPAGTLEDDAVNEDTIEDGAVGEAQIADDSITPVKVTADTYQATQTDATIATDITRVTAETVVECETIVNAAGTAGTNLFYNGGINGNMAYGLWCPKERDALLGSSPGRGLVHIKNEMVSNASAPYGVAVKSTLAWNVFELDSVAGPGSVRLFGLVLCKPLVAGNTYRFLMHGKCTAYDTSTGSFIADNEYLAYFRCRIGNLSTPSQVNFFGSSYFSGTEEAFVGLAFVATEAMAAETKINPMVFIEFDEDTSWRIGLSGSPYKEVYFECHSLMVVESDTVPGAWSDCLLGAYNNTTRKIKQTVEGLAVSGYDAGVQIDGKAVVTPTEFKLTNASGTSLVSMTGGAFSSGNGVASGKSLSVTLTVAGWSSLSQTVTVTGLLADATVLCSPAPSSKAVAEAAGVYCSSQAAGSLTFACSSVPTEAITMNILALGGVTT